MKNLAAFLATMKLNKLTSIIKVWFVFESNYFKENVPDLFESFLIMNMHQSRFTNVLQRVSLLKKNN